MNHASSCQLLSSDLNNLGREVNKAIVSGFFKELKLTLGDATTPIFEYQFDRLLSAGDESKNRLNSIMPLLNSVQLYGRYKQKFSEALGSITIYHTTPFVGQ